MKSNPSQDPLQRDIREWSNTSEKGQSHNQPKGKIKGKGMGKKKHPGKGNHNQDQTGSPNEDGQRTLGDFGKKRSRVEIVGDVQENDDFKSPRLDRAAYVFCVQKCNSISMDSTELPSLVKRVCDGYEEPAGTHEKFDQSTGEVLFAVGCRDDRPIVDSGSVVSTCPVDYATSVPTEKLQFRMNLESVLGESLQHYGIKRNVPFINRSGSSMNVNFEVTDTKCAILSVHKGCGNGSMIVFTPDGKGKIVNDKNCIEQVKRSWRALKDLTLCMTGEPTYWTWMSMMESMSTMRGNSLNTIFLVIRKEYWERALSQAQQDHERQQRIQRDVHGENQNTHEQIKVKVPPKPYEPTKEERQSHEATHCLFRAWCEVCVKAKSPDGKHTKQLGNAEHIPVIEFDYAFATDTPGDPNRKISMIVATDSIHGSIFAVVARRKGGQDDHVMQSFQNYIDRLGLVRAELKCDQAPSTLDVANTLIKRCQSTISKVTATPKNSK